MLFTVAAFEKPSQCSFRSTCGALAKIGMNALKERVPTPAHTYALCPHRTLQPCNLNVLQEGYADSEGVGNVISRMCVTCLAP